MTNPPKTLQAAKEQIAQLESKLAGNKPLPNAPQKPQTPHNPKPTKPFGGAAKAMEAVSTWRFQPATRKGQPIAAQADVEVSFRFGP